MSLAKDCYSMKPDLLTNATVVDDAVRFVSSKSKEKIRSSSHGSSDEEEVEELQEPNYEEPGEINHISITTNDVF
ncbi:MAG: hypothetical protein ACJ72R_05925 [Nitrososphaeraceae archaeon]